MFCVYCVPTKTCLYYVFVNVKHLLLVTGKNTMHLKYFVAFEGVSSVIYVLANDIDTTNVPFKVYYCITVKIIFF